MIVELFYPLLILLVTTRVCGALAFRIGQPPLVGELLAGVGLGVLAAHYELSFLSDFTENEVFDSLADLGMFFLMLLAGVELEARTLAKASLNAIWVAIGGFVLPLGLGFALGRIFIPPSPTKTTLCLFIGTALAITAIPVAVRALMDIRKLESDAGQTIVSAAIFDDVFGLLLLAVLVTFIGTGEIPQPSALAIIALKLAVFFTITGFLAIFVAPHIGRLLTLTRVAEFKFSALVAAALAYALLAELLGMHFIVGAFVAGLSFNPQATTPKMYSSVKERLSGITIGFLAPIFFASVGMHLKADAIVAIPVFLVLLIATAFLAKLVGAGLAAYFVGFSKRDAIAVGVGMSGRGAVELIIADIALQAGLFSTQDPSMSIVGNLYSAIIIMAIITTLVSPIGLRYFMKDS